MAKEIERPPIKRWGKESVDQQALPKLPSGAHYLKGEFAGLREVEGQFGKGLLLEIDVGDERQVWGCPAYLQERLRQVTRLGTWIAIVPIGMVQSKGNMAYDFRVFVLEGPKDEIPDVTPF